MITSTRLHCVAPRASAAFLVMMSLHGCDSAGAGAAAPTLGGSDLALFQDVLRQVQRSYVEPVTDNELVKDALKGMLTRLDPHSDYMDQEQYEQLTAVTRGQFGGIGVELTLEARVPEVIAPIEGTPAADAGIEPGDRISKIDAQPTTGMDVEEIVKRLRGAPGTKVILTISRNDRPPFDVTLTRAVIHVVSVKSDLKGDNIGYVRIAAFTESTAPELATAISRLKDRAHGRLNGLILDLRNDPGGLLDSAVHIAGDFLDGGTIVSIRGQSSGEDEIYDARSNGDRLRGVPVVVLINSASASASEIVAGALQDRHRATILGTRSFGKGSVQTIIPLDGHGALRLTTARYYTPSGRSIQGEGIAPDVVVLPPRDQQVIAASTVHETDLRGALKNTGPESGTPRGAASPAVQKTEEAEDVAIDPAVIGTARDYQLSVALKRIKEMVARSAPGGRS